VHLADPSFSEALQDRYLLLRELGAGGMATVYLAEDVKHHRKVAVKVLRPELAALLGAERFLKEIEVTANLQHPHILPLFDSGIAGTRLFYVMPYVEGETLRVRLNREKQLPVAEAVRIATEAASALDYAHRHGLIHRDVKPENILLHDGRALVADFGIALAVSRAGGSRVTETGLSLGTPQYMSPEQATADRDLTPRSDVYALGCVLYEMLTGDPPHTGSTAQAIIAKVITEAPRPIRPARPSVPAHVEAAVLTALQKLPADRFATPAEFAAALAGGTAPVASGVTTAVLTAPAPLRRPVRISGAAALALGALALGGGVGWIAARRSHPETHPARVSLAIPSDRRVVVNASPTAALSPDGTTLIYGGVGDATQRLYARRLDDLTPAPMAGTEGACCPKFSADGRSILYLDTRSNAWVRMSSGGGPATRIAGPENLSDVVAVAGSEEVVATLEDGSLARVGSDGEVNPIARPDSAAGEIQLSVMQALPGGAVLALATNQPPEGPLIAIDPRSGARSKVIASRVEWAGFAQGRLVWSQGGGVLYAAPFDPDKLRLTGPAQALGVTAQITRGGQPKVTLSARGDALAYIPAAPATLALVARDGRAATLLAEPRTYHSPRISPDGHRVLFDFSQATRDVWELDLDDTTLTRVTFEKDGHDPTWLPDGRGFVFASARGGQIGVFRRRLDGSEKAESLLIEGPQVTLHTVTPDGRTGIAARASNPGATGYDLVAVSLAGPGPSRPILQSGYNEDYPALSPDGRWLAYVSDESNQPEVYLRPLQGEGGKVRVSQNGGIEPVWSRNGRELFYRSLGPRERQLMAAAIEVHPTLRVLSRTPLFDMDEYEPATPHANYDVMPDGRSFLMVRLGRLSEFVYLQHWTALLPRASAAP
jgi:serine/threonine-protein kinase